MKNLFKISALGLLLGTPAFSGGWEADRLDTSMMYSDGGYAEVLTKSISDVSATSGAAVGAIKHKMESINMFLSFKTQYGNRHRLI